MKRINENTNNGIVSYKKQKINDNKKFIKSKGTYDDFECIEKKKNNLILVKMANYIDNPIYNIIALDGPKMGSTNTFIKYLDIKGEIYIPEINYNTHLIHKKSGKCNAYFGTVHDIVNNKNIVAYCNIAYLDFTGSIEGNTKNYPLQDINDLLKNTAMKRILLVVTFSMRDELFEDRENSQEQIYRDFLKLCFKFNQFKIIKRKIYTYKRTKPDNSKSSPMFFGAFILDKDCEIDNSKCHLIISDKPNKWGKKYFKGYNPTLDENMCG